MEKTGFPRVKMLDSERQRQSQLHLLAQLMCDEWGWEVRRGERERRGRREGGRESRQAAAKFLTYFYSILK